MRISVPAAVEPSAKVKGALAQNSPRFAELQQDPPRSRDSPRIGFHDVEMRALLNFLRARNRVFKKVLDIPNAISLS